MDLSSINTTAQVFIQHYRTVQPYAVTPGWPMPQTALTARPLWCLGKYVTIKIKPLKST